MFSLAAAHQWVANWFLQLGRDTRAGVARQALAGRIYYEAHIAPLLRMQGTFEEFAIDFLKPVGQPLEMIANAAERRDADGKPLSIHMTLTRATDRRRYEKELLGARDLAKV
jgi:phosphoserine phosphatase RsbU/P